MRPADFGPLVVGLSITAEVTLSQIYRYTIRHRIVHWPGLQGAQSIQPITVSLITLLGGILNYLIREC